MRRSRFSGAPVAEPVRSPRWSPPAIWRRAREVLRDDGVVSLWFKVVGELVYRRVWIFERRLDHADHGSLAPQPGVAIGELDCGDLDLYRTLRPDADPAVVRARLAAGERCFVARRNGRLLHAAWVATGEAHIEYLGRSVELGPSDAYVYEAFSATDARGQSHSVAVAAQIARRLEREGRRRLLCVVMPENRAGAKASRSWGYRRRGRLRTLRVGQRRLHFGDFGCVESDGEYWSHACARLAAGEHYLDPFLGELKRQRHLRLVREWGALDPAGRLLKTDGFEEAGGLDAFLADLDGEAGELHGIDIAPLVVRRARERTGTSTVRWTVADVRHLPFPEGYFSTVVSTSTLDHFTDSRDLGRSLRELLRVLRVGGRLVITLDNRQNVFDPLLRLASRVGRMPYFVGRSYTARELRRELEEAGFEVLRTTSILHNPRLLAVGSVRLARRIGLRTLTVAVERLLVAAQRLERTRWRHLTGSFVAAAAARPAQDASASRRDAAWPVS